MSAPRSIRAFLVAGVVAACASCDSQPAYDQPLTAPTEQVTVAPALPFGGDLAACEADTNALWTKTMPVLGTHGHYDGVFDEPAMAVMKKYGIPGMALAVRGQPVAYARGYGFADPARHDLMNPDQVFRLGDAGRLLITSGLHTNSPKPIISFDPSGLLDQFFDDITRVDGSAVPFDRAITVYHLLAGTAGWDDATYNPLEHLAEISKQTGETFPPSAKAMLRAALSQPAAYKPGAMYCPSVTATLMLGHLIEREYGSFDAVLTPVGTSSAMWPDIADPSAVGASLLAARLDNEATYVDDPKAPAVASIFGGGQVARPYGGIPIESLGTGRILGSALGLLGVMGLGGSDPRVGGAGASTACPGHARPGEGSGTIIAHLPGSTVIVTSGFVAMLNTSRDMDPAVETALVADLVAAVKQDGFLGGATTFGHWTPFGPLEAVAPQVLYGQGGAANTIGSPLRFDGHVNVMGALEWRAKIPGGSDLGSAGAVASDWVFGASCPVFRARHDALVAAGNALFSYQTYDDADGHKRYQAVWTRLMK